MKLNAKQLRKGQNSNSPSGARIQKLKLKIKRNDIYIVLDDVLDTYNIGSIFRLADAVAAKKVYLCGGTEIPPNHRIKKASINTTEVVEWEYCESAVAAITKLTSEVKKMQLHLGGVKPLQVIAIEQDKRSIQYNQFGYTLPICLIVGNETTGVSKEVLDMVDGIVELPMFGVNKSLNVMVSLGIVSYEVASKCLP
ncbi:TrmH family RNA methyltransferase [Candidatus Daviesbacteria bacterium]|nr:TrmH family RNA methyltransferase [Candidatus Daviesbacteria bacterium]